ncbi:MAG TPA: SoxR reducing system RseC family protein [Candidatus Mcinerneyibacteriales bacterium]|nr:SoxR reducing system RseC family protein [Candidatus Mcinerneyibacteriales bacterium]HPE19881.1 SoxR reducing system RseC family protein [Candidatus Mcinerneyibacteriales bacterium]HPJ69599.1 SoxR reducing system RseC family protein [Candidatus Mcinerneyibacteriales bacterium]HPQ90161.1 SoxR reducing system RseC family protein [Candidatus Mcinerneyibacteriales bacterium]
MILEGWVKEKEKGRIFLVSEGEAHGKNCSGCGLCPSEPRGKWITLPDTLRVERGDRIKLTLPVTPAFSFLALLAPLASAIAGALLASLLLPGEGWTVLGALIFFTGSFFPLHLLNEGIRKKIKVEILDEGRHHETGH